MGEGMERIARAMFAEAWTRFPYDFGPAYEHDQELFEAMARAAVEAMREPSEAMELAAENDDCDGRAGPANHWRSMIDALLTEGGRTEAGE